MLTDCDLPLGTEVTLTLKKGGKEIEAGARVVRIAPQEGVAFAFTSMEGEDFRILDHWLSTFVTASWVVENRRSGHRVAMKIEVQISGYSANGASFKENTHTVEINALGGSVFLRTQVEKEQRVVLTNLQTKVTVECMVVSSKPVDTGWQVGIAFVSPNQPFWPLRFPPADWSFGHQDTKHFDSNR